MALRFKEDYKFFHIPKTGGNYVRAVLRRAFEPEILREGRHPHCGGLAFGGRHVFDHSFCCVRAPYTWYQSFYRYRVQNGWKTDHPLDINCKANSYEQFIRNILKIWNGNPNGYVTALYLKYIPFCKYVLRMENLTEELRQLFIKWHIRWPEKIAYTQINVSDKNIRCSLSPELSKRLHEADAEMTTYLGYSKSGNPINHTVG